MLKSVAEERHWQSQWHTDSATRPFSDGCQDFQGLGGDFGTGAIATDDGDLHFAGIAHLETSFYQLSVE